MKLREKLRGIDALSIVGHILVVMLILLVLFMAFYLGVKTGQEGQESHQSRLIYLETQTYDVAGLDEDQYVMRWFDRETMQVIEVDVRGKERAEEVRCEIESQ